MKIDIHRIIRDPETRIATNVFLKIGYVILGFQRFETGIFIPSRFLTADAPEGTSEWIEDGLYTRSEDQPFARAYALAGAILKEKRKPKKGREEIEQIHLFREL